MNRANRKFQERPSSRLANKATQQSSLSLACERVVWAVFLLCLFATAFVPGRIDHPHWYYLAPTIMLIAASAILLRFRYVQHLHLPPLFLVLVLMLCGLVWLMLQSLIPMESALHQRLFPVELRPLWFTPDFKWSLVPHLSKLLALRDVIVFAIFLSTVLLCTNKARVSALLWVFSLVGLVHAGLGYLAWISGQHLVDLAAIDGHFSAMRGLFINRNHFAGFLLACSLGSIIPLIYRCYQLRSLTLSNKVLEFISSSAIIHLAILAGFTFCIIMSESRAGFAGVLIIIAVLVFGFGVKRAAKSEESFLNRYLGKALIFLLAVVVSLVSIILFDHGVVERFADSASVLGDRPLQWLVTISAIVERPLIGYGGGSYATVFEIFRDGYPLRPVFYDQAHNQYLHLMLEQGLIGLLLFLGVLLIGFINLQKSMRFTASRFRHAQLLAVMGVLCAILFQSLFDFNLQIVRLRVFFFVSLALVFVLAKYDYHRPHHLKTKHE